MFFGADADHGPHRGIILRSRVVDDFHIADVIAAQAAQFAVIAHQPPVDIDNRRAFAQDLKAVLAARHSRHFGQHFLCRPRILKHRALDGGNHRVTCQPCLGQLAFYDYFAEHLCIYCHLDGQAVCGPCILGLVAHARHFHQAVFFVGRQEE